MLASSQPGPRPPYQHGYQPGPSYAATPVFVLLCSAATFSIYAIFIFLLDTLSLKWSETQAGFSSTCFLCLEEGCRDIKTEKGVRRSDGKRGWKVWRLIEK